MRLRIRHKIFTLIVALAVTGSPGVLKAAGPDSTWKSTNPGAGGAFGVVGAGPGGVILAGGDLSGAYRSLDRGETWDLIGSFRGLTSTHVCGVGFDPTNEAVLFIGTEHGLFRSADTGSTVTQVISDGYITDVKVLSTDSSRAYAAWHSKYNQADGQVYGSSDNGLTWNKISADLPGGLHILKILVHPENPDTMYLLSGKTSYSSGQRVAYRSWDGGIHWTQTGSALGEVKDIQFDKSDFSTLYLSTFLVFPDDYGFLYRSEDNGDSWTEVAHRTGYIWLDPGDPGFIRLIELGYQYPGGSRSGVWASADTGVTWNRYSDIGEWDRGWSKYYHYGATFNGEAKTFGEDMSDPDALFWITSQWVFGSFDGGLTFRNLYTNEIDPGRWQSRGINNAVLFDIEISPADPDIIYLGYFDLGFFRSLDHGMSWENCNDPFVTGEWKGDGGSSYTIAADPTRPEVVWAAQAQDRTSVKRLLRSSDSGSVDSWERAGTGLPSTTSLFGLSVDPYSPESERTLFITAERNVYMSNDDGYNWTLSLDCGGTCHFTAIDRFNGYLVYAGGSGGVWRSRAGGIPGSWKEVGLQEMKGSKVGNFWDYGWTGVMDIETDPLNPDWVYAAVYGSGRGLYRSRDRGDTWEKLWTDNFMRGVAVSPVNSQVIYAVSSKPLNAGGYDVKSNGILMSKDGGETWTEVNEGLSWPFASSIEIDPVNPHRVMIASPGEGCNYRSFLSGGPVRTGLSPRGTLPPGTGSVTLSLTTDRAATCRYSLTPDRDFDEMEYVFSTDEGIFHSSLFTGMTDNNTYNIYCRCRDNDQDTNPDDYQISFRVGENEVGLPVTEITGDFSIEAGNSGYGDVVFTVTKAMQGDFMIRVFDITGRLVWSYTNDDSGPGVHHIGWDTAGGTGNNRTCVYVAVLSSITEQKTTSRLFMK